MKRRLLFTEEQVKQAVIKSHCWTSVVIELGFTNASGTRIKQVLKAVQEQFPNLDTSHFQRTNHVLYKRVTKKCPVCGDEFSTRLCHRDEKTTCSIACSNTHFRSGDNNGFRAKKQGRTVRNNGKRLTYQYQEICWQNHVKKCIVCGEERIVEAHHYNGNHNDNRPENFAPLCPTHHLYWHSRHRSLIQRVVDDYVKTFIMKLKIV